MLYFTQTPALNDEEKMRFKKALDWYVNETLRGCRVPIDCVRVLHRMLQQNVVYPSQKLEQNGAIPVAILPETEEGQHYISAYGALVNKRANSYGIARAVQAVLNDPRVGIRSELVEGCVLSEQKTPSMHLWNIVTVARHSYHVDTAMEILTNSRTMRHASAPGVPLEALDSDELPTVETLMPGYVYCLTSDDVMRQNHIWNKNDTPRCLSSYVPPRRI